MAKKISMKGIVKSLGRNQAFKAAVYKNVKKRFDREKKELINTFNRHPVTREIEGGRSASNDSGTLGNYGNLYTFIGFMAGSMPTDQLRKIIFKRTRLERKAKRITPYRSKGMKLEYNVLTPQESEITAATPMPWEGGRSWAYGIERGISGFGFYIYKKWKTSRSGEGIQSNKKIRGGTFKRRGYLSEIWTDFAKKLR